MNRALAVPDQLLGQGAETAQAAVHAPGDVAELFAEDQSAGEGSRVGELGGEDVAGAGLSPADRDLAAGLGQIELAELAGAVVGALKAARCRQVAGLKLSQKDVEDRLAAVVAVELDLLEDADTRDRRVVVEQLLDPGPVRVEL